MLVLDIKFMSWYHTTATTTILSGNHLQFTVTEYALSVNTVSKFLTLYETISWLLVVSNTGKGELKL
jgi:hypothetical protein